jgi:two-component system nitrogen regulation response regulator GlnG
MAPGREIHTDELPPELTKPYEAKGDFNDNWETSLTSWVEQQLLTGAREIAKQTIPQVETILIKSALKFTNGKRHEAANLLGYGRNTLTRKIKELELDS